MFIYTEGRSFTNQKEAKEISMNFKTETFVKATRIKLKGMLRGNIEHFQKKCIYEKLGFSEMK